MVRLVKQHKLEPVIVFSFSKKECEVYALKMAEHDFLTGEFLVKLSLIII